MFSFSVFSPSSTHPSLLQRHTGIYAVYRVAFYCLAISCLSILISVKLFAASTYQGYELTQVNAASVGKIFDYLESSCDGPSMTILPGTSYNWGGFCTNLVIGPVINGKSIPELTFRFDAALYAKEHCQLYRPFVAVVYTEQRNLSIKTKCAYID